MVFSGSAMDPSRYPKREAPRIWGRSWVFHRRKFSRVSFSVIWLLRGFAVAWDEEEDMAAGKERLDVFWKGSSDYHVKIRKRVYLP